MFKYNPFACLPSAEALPDSDDTPTAEERAKRLAAKLPELSFNPKEILCVKRSDKRDRAYLHRL